MKALIILFATATLLFATPSPTPIPFGISRAELSKIPKADIEKTIQSRDQLHFELQQKFDDQQIHIVTQDKVLVQTAAALSNATVQNGILQKQVQDQTDKLNSTQDKLDKAAKALWWYRLHWWGAWVMLGLGILACGIFAFLKFTGRLSIIGAQVAAKIP
jgi:hypothetical protein